MQPRRDGLRLGKAKRERPHLERPLGSDGDGSSLNKRCFVTIELALPPCQSESLHSLTQNLCVTHGASRNELVLCLSKKQCVSLRVYASQKHCGSKLYTLYVGNIQTVPRGSSKKLKIFCMRLFENLYGKLRILVRTRLQEQVTRMGAVGGTTT